MLIIYVLAGEEECTTPEQKELNFHTTNIIIIFSQQSKSL